MMHEVMRYCVHIHTLCMHRQDVTYIARFDFYPWIHICIRMLSTLSIAMHACCDWLAVKCTRFVGSVVVIAACADLV